MMVRRYNIYFSAPWSTHTTYLYYPKINVVSFLDSQWQLQPARAWKKRFKYSVVH